MIYFIKKWLCARRQRLLSEQIVALKAELETWERLRSANGTLPEYRWEWIGQKRAALAVLEFRDSKLKS